MIVDKHNCLNHQTANSGVTQQAFLAKRECPFQSTPFPLTRLPKRGVNIRNEEKIIAHIMVKTSCHPFCDWSNKITIYVPTSRESLVNTYLVQEHPPLHVMQEPCCKTPVCSTTWKVDCSKKYLSLLAISEHIIHHCVAIIAAIYCVLCNTIICTFGRERNAVNETYDIVNKRLSHLDK